MGCVIKMGGSLADTAGEVLSALADASVNALIVPGGGAFADSVRAEHLDDDAAHWKAIASMNRYGVFLSSFGFPLTETLALPASGSSILLPEKMLRIEDPLPHSWDVTSDSIALWAAETMHLPLVLIKSRAGDISDAEYVDSYFRVLLERSTVSVSVVNGRDADALRRCFQGV